MCLVIQLSSAVRLKRSDSSELSDKLHDWYMSITLRRVSLKRASASVSLSNPSEIGLQNIRRVITLLHILHTVSLARY